MKYLLNLHADHLTYLVSIWQPKVILLSAAIEMPESWGPTVEEVARIQHYEFHESTEEYGGGSDDEGEDEEVSGGEDMGLLEAIEEADLAGESFGTDDLDDELFDAAALSYVPTRNNSPKKHHTRM